MPGYGFEALQSMYSGPTMVDKKNAELAQLQQALATHRNEQKEKETAALQMAEYDKSVDAFAEKLLGPDRNALFQTAKVLKQSVREMIKNSGGDMKQFFQNGGHQIMDDYKTGIMRSEESTRYLQNKEKMVSILKLMNEGKSHLISPIDQANFDAYMKNGGGELTYSGTMGEIKMPDPSAYRYGEEIPTQDILNSNRATIISNYSIYHKGTDKDPLITGKIPSEAELLAFTAGMYGTTTGSNYQRDIALDNQNLSWNKELRDQAEFPYEMQKQILDNKQAEANIETTLLQNDNLVIGQMAGVNSGQQSGTKKDTLSAEIAELENKREYDEFALYGTIASDTNLTVGSIVTDWEKNLEKGKDQLSLTNLFNGRWKDKGARRENFTGPSDIWGPWGNDRFTPAVAARMFKDAATAEKFKKAAIQRMGLTYENGKVKGLRLKKGMTGVYSFDGVDLGNGHSSLDGEFSDKADDYVVREVISAPITTANGKRQIVMNRNGQLMKEGYGVNDNAKPSVFLVLESGRNGNRRIYVEVDPSNEMVQKDMSSLFNITGAVKQSKIRKAKREENEAIVRGYKNEFDLAKRVIRANPRHIANMQQVSPGGGRDPMVEDIFSSFYFVAKDLDSGLTFDEIATNYSSEIINMIRKSNNSNLMGRMKKGGSVTPSQFFDELEKSHSDSPTELQRIRQWRDIYYKIKK